MINAVDGQPILFNESGVDAICCPATDWNHQFFTNDTVPFQLIVGKDETLDNLVLNPSFVQDGTNWDVSLGLVLYNPAHSGALLVTQIARLRQSGLAISLNQWVEIRIDVHIYDGRVSEEKIHVNGFLQDIEFYASTNSFTFYAQGDGSGTIHISRSGVTTNNFMYIEGVYVNEITLPTLSTIDVEGDELSVIADAAYTAPYLSAIFQIGAAEQAAKCFRFKAVLHDTIFESELIQVITANDCDLLIGGCSNNTMYSSDSPLYFRAKGKVLADQVPIYDRFTTRKNNGMHRLNYARKSKVFTLTVDRVPEHVRDFIYSLPLMGVVGIKTGSGVQKNYFVFEEPDPPEFTTGDDDLASVTLRLMHKQELSEMIYDSECNFILPPKALGIRSENTAYRVGENTAIRVP